MTTKQKMIYWLAAPVVLILLIAFAAKQWTYISDLEIQRFELRQNLKQVRHNFKVLSDSAYKWQKQNNEWKTVMRRDTNFRLYYKAFQYHDSVFTPVSFIRFLLESGVKNPKESFCTAMKETGLTAGQAKWRDNLYGFKKSRRCTTFYHNVEKWNNVRFPNKYFSALQFEVFRRKFKNWSKWRYPKYMSMFDRLAGGL